VPGLDIDISALGIFSQLFILSPGGRGKENFSYDSPPFMGGGRGRVKCLRRYITKLLLKLNL